MRLPTVHHGLRQAQTNTHMLFGKGEESADRNQSAAANQEGDRATTKG